MSSYTPPSRLQRKWQKLRRDPVRFFADTKNSLLRKGGLWALMYRNAEAAKIFARIRDGTEELGKWIAPMPRPKAPDDNEWRQLAEAPANRTDKVPIVDVIVPVYRGYGDTLACLHSLLAAAQQTPHEVIVIDDASPEPGLSSKLAELAATGLFTLFQNDRNLGFVQSANRGMAWHTSRDVVLLNADTVVYGDWLDRLRRHAVFAPDVATVTPLSNNATICSYPETNSNNNTRIEVDFAELDALASVANRGNRVEAPTGVGFCMYVRRDCLDRVGLFDARRFGRGYGEENDLCQKAVTQGMSNLIATDVFVRHTGEVSFANTARREQKKALGRLAQRFPDYDSDVRHYIARDPIAPARQALDIARLVRAAGGPNPVLFVTHSRGGGVERHICDTIETLRKAGTGAILLRSAQERPGRWTLNTVDDLYLPNLNPVVHDNLVEVLRRAGISRVQIHSLADYPRDAVRKIPELASVLGVPYEFMVHDYLSVCPRINLIDSSGVYCGEQGQESCRACLAPGQAPFGQRDVADWRADYAALLTGAEAIQAPSHDAAHRIGRYFTGLSVNVRPHEDRANPPENYHTPVRQSDEPLRVAVIGAIGPHKGSHVLLQCARDAKRRKLPLEFVIVGHTNIPELDSLTNVTVTGPYQENEVFDLIMRHRCHVAFLPSVWPETYSYTLSIAQNAGLPVLAFDLGAIAERLSKKGSGWLVPWALVKQPSRLADVLVEFGGVHIGDQKKAPDGNSVRAAFEAAPALGPNTAAFLRPPSSTTNYCICFTPRSGSSWLTDLLTSTKHLGRPDEWFNPNHLPSILERFGCNDAVTYVDILRRRTRTPNGVFGVEISFFQLKQLEEVVPLDALFGPDLKYFYLTREDFVLQAISLYRAVETGYFHSIQTMTGATAEKLDRLSYDADKIEHWVRHILQQERGFDALFADRGIDPLRLTYEQLIQSPTKCVQSIADCLQVDTAVVLSDSLHTQISGKTNSNWAKRFCADRVEFVECWRQARGHTHAP